MANRFHNPRPQFMNATPVVYSAGILRFYASGTSTPQNVYSGSGLTGASTTITLNSAGRPSQDIFLSNALYKVTLEDSLGNEIWSVDPYMTSDYTTTAKVTGYSGNPNGFVAGTASAGAVPADMVWDRTNHILYVCTTTGVAAAAVWTVANSSDGLDNWTTAGRNVSPTEGVDFGYNTTLHGLEYWNASRWVTLGRLPTVQRFTSGSGNYTTPAGVTYLKVTLCGPGGGGGATATNAGANGSADTSFGTWTAVKGSGGAANGVDIGGAGGTGGTDGTGAKIKRFDGGQGGGRLSFNTNGAGAAGGANPFGGAGQGTGNGAGLNARANTGAGGGAGGGNAGSTGNGGGAGEYVEFFVYPTTEQVLAYVVGAGGAGGVAGTNVGGIGAAGVIIVEEY